MWSVTNLCRHKFIDDHVLQEDHKILNITYASSPLILLFLTALVVLISRAYERLLKISAKGHTKATEKVAYAMLFGDYMTQNITRAKSLFEKLALDGSPKAQMVCLLLFIHLMFGCT